MDLLLLSCSSPSKHDSDQTDHTLTTIHSPDIESDGHLSWSVREREIKLHRQTRARRGRPELCTCLNKHFHSELTATTSKDRVWQLSEASTNWVRKNNKNYRYTRPGCDQIVFSPIDLTIAMRCGCDDGSGWIVSFSKIAAQRKTRNGN